MHAEFLNGAPTAFDKIKRKFSILALTHIKQFKERDNNNPSHFFQRTRDCVLGNHIPIVNNRITEPFLIFACYMNELQNKENGDHLIEGDDNLGNIFFVREFVEALELNRFEIPQHGTTLRGFPFITSSEINESISNVFVNQGAVLIGRDITGTRGSSELQPNKDCMFFVAKKYVAFAVLEKFKRPLLLSAQLNNLYSITYTTPDWINPNQVTIIARSLEDLGAICPSMPEYKLFPCFMHRNPQTIVISIGFKGFKADGLLYQLGALMDVLPMYKIKFFVCGSCRESETVQTYFAHPGNNFIYNAAIYRSPVDTFDIDSIDSPWSFALTQVGRAVNVHDNPQKYSHMTCPVRGIDAFSIQISRHSKAKFSILEFATFMEAFLGDPSCLDWLDHFNNDN